MRLGEHDDTRRESYCYSYFDRFFVSIVVCVFLEKMKSEDSDEEKYPLIDMGEENISDK